MKGSEAIVQTLIKKGTDVTFGFPGGVLIPLFDTFLEHENKIRNILVRHEQGAVHAAEGYARVLDGQPGVCIATSGPGATNLVTGIMDAYMDSTPLIAFGGQVDSKLIGNDAFQETDMMGITLPITKHNFQPRKADELVPTILKAYKIATEGRPGPVYIDLPKDATTDQTTKPIPKEVVIKSYNPILKPNLNQVKKAAEAIMKAERPVFLIGGGVVLANASKELTKLVELVKAPVSTTIMAKGAFPENHPLCLGTVGMHGRKIANYALVHTDLIITIGCRFSDRITGNLQSFAEKAKVIHADIDPAEISKNVKVDIPIVGDAKNVIIALNDTITKLAAKGKYAEWTKKMKELREICDACIDHTKGSKKIHPKAVLDVMNKILMADDIVTTGVGQHQMFSSHFLKFMKPRKFITSGGAGTMGFGFPAAVGAKVAAPDKRVFDIDGDGSFQMTIQELATVKEENIKVVPVIFNNQYLGMVRQWLELFFEKRYSQVNLGKVPDLVKVAEAYGLSGIHVEKPSQIEAALKEAAKAKETMLVNILIEEESNILPMLPPGGHLKEAFGKCLKAPGQFF
ncbi:biosynthetic-type acetolactate synthase large subunit [Nanoarchaeota archaeon]